MLRLANQLLSSASYSASYSAYRHEGVINLLIYSYLDRRAKLSIFLKMTNYSFKVYSQLIIKCYQFWALAAAEDDEDRSCRGISFN